MNIIVDYNQWVNGSNNDNTTRSRGHSKLLNSEGFKCCLGFGAEQCGIPLNEIDEMIPFPCEVPEKYWNSEFLSVFLENDSEDNEFSLEAAGINDDYFIGDKERMSKLKALAIEHGHTFTFMNVPKELCEESV